MRHIMCHLRNHSNRWHGLKSLRPLVVKMPQTYKHTNWPWFIHKSHALRTRKLSFWLSRLKSNSGIHGANPFEPRPEKLRILGSTKYFHFLTTDQLGQSIVNFVGDIFNKSVTKSRIGHQHLHCTFVTDARIPAWESQFESLYLIEIPVFYR